MSVLRPTRFTWPLAARRSGRWRAALAAALAAVLAASAAAGAADLPGAWSELTPDGGLDVRAVVARDAACPAVAADGAAIASETRGATDNAYPVQVCVAHATAGARAVTAAGLPVAALPRVIRRIVAIGDTGCRLKDPAIQDCNSPADWPFATVARLAALHKPDLVIHVGDYHYRESACPAGRPGCAGSPFGDTWAVWKADFFDPAAPLLAAAPWVMVRGNHELCGRGGKGWFRLLDPHPALLDCPKVTDPYVVRLDALDLLVLDSADANDSKAPPEKVTLYRDQLAALLGQARPHAWLLTHRPIWSMAEGVGVPSDAVANLTEQAAISGLPQEALDLVLSGHIHDFMALAFGPEHPAQLVTGNGGTMNDLIGHPIEPGEWLGDARVERALTTARYGFSVLDRTPSGWQLTLRGLDDAPIARCTLQGRDLRCEPAPGGSTPGDN